jgi:hypothetical protein
LCWGKTSTKAGAVSLAAAVVAAADSTTAIAFGMAEALEGAAAVAADEATAGGAGSHSAREG